MIFCFEFLHNFYQTAFNEGSPVFFSRYCFHIDLCSLAEDNTYYTAIKLTVSTLGCSVLSSPIDTDNARVGSNSSSEDVSSAVVEGCQESRDE